MNGQAERELLGEYLAVCARLATAFAANSARAERVMPISAEAIDTLSDEDDVAVLAFLKRFEQIEDALQRTIKTIVQLMQLGKTERLFPKDVANRAEQLGIVANADDWSDIVRTRNALAHEYPLQPGKRAAQVNNAWDARHRVLSVWQNIQLFVTNEGLA